jgi:hypothetical protein
MRAALRGLRKPDLNLRDRVDPTRPRRRPVRSRAAEPMTRDAAGGQTGIEACMQATWRDALHLISVAAAGDPPMQQIIRISLLLALASLLVSGPAWAGPNDNEINPVVDPADIAKALAKKERPLFVGALGGVAWVAVEHPEMSPSSFAAPILGLHAGYAFTPHWALSLELTTIEKHVVRPAPGAKFAPAGSIQPQQGCFLCPDLPRPEGQGPGQLLEISAIFGTIAPRLELTPFGRDGLFVSVSAGLAFVHNLAARAGGAGTGRVGFRLRLVEVLTFSIEGGVQGQAFSDASAVLPYAAAIIRPYF